MSSEYQMEVGSRAANALQPRFTVRSPLIAFERVYRHSGAICKTCVFENVTDDPIQLDVVYSFREHSWVQWISEVEGATEELDRITLPPGRTRIHVLMNTDSSNFPYDEFRGRIEFRESARDQLPVRVEISFESIEELRDFEGYAAIDLGTCNSVISLYHLRNDAVTGAPWSPELEEQDAAVPSAVFVRDLAGFKTRQSGSCSVGRAAIEEYRNTPELDPRSLQVGVKRLIGTDRVLAADANGAGGYVEPLAILFALGRHIRERAQGHDGVRARLAKLIVTFPPTWDYEQIDQWREVFRQLGYADDDLDLSLDEASAAGLHSIYQWTRDSDARQRLLQDLLHSRVEVVENGEPGERYVLKLISFDFGGGTTDLAFLEVELTLIGESTRMRVAVLGSDSLPFGGDQVTLAVFRILKRRLAMAVADPARTIPPAEGADGIGRGQDSDRATSPDAAAASTPTGLFALPGDKPRARIRDHEHQTQGANLIRQCWEEIEAGIGCEALSPEIEDAIDEIVPTRFWRCPEEPINSAAKHTFGWLWDQAERIKRELFVESSRRTTSLGLSGTNGDDVRRELRLGDVPAGVLRVPTGGTGGANEAAGAHVVVSEIYRSISAPLEEALRRARSLASGSGVDRVVLTGQSSWIPLVRRLFMRPSSEGGFGLAPGKIEFDRENAKSAVSKGACLLRVMRHAFVGVSVDVSSFKANLLADLFYKCPLGGDRVLFRRGPIDDLRCVEESPDPRGFARHLAVFSGSADRLLGQFDFAAAGEAVPEVSDARAELLEGPNLRERELPSLPEVQVLRTRDPERFAEIADVLAGWSERELIAWMERGAARGAPDRPIYRYYLSRNRNLIAVRDRGDAGCRLFALQMADRPPVPLAPRDNPFSGLH